jgi:hypothetical protein
VPAPPDPPAGARPNDPDYAARLRARIAAAGPPPGSPEPQTAAQRADAALRAKIAAEAFQLRSRALRKAQEEVAAVKADLRALAGEMGPRIQALEARLVVLSRTIGHMLAELDQTHATTVVALRRGTTPPLGELVLPEAPEQLADPNAPTPRPGAGPEGP